MFCHLSLGKVFGALLKTVSVCGRKLSSLSSPSSLNGLQAFEIKRYVVRAMRKFILPVFGGYPPHPPFFENGKATDCGDACANHHMLRKATT